MLSLIEEIEVLPQKTFTHFKGHFYQKKMFTFKIIITDFFIWLTFIQIIVLPTVL